MLQSERDVGYTEADYGVDYCRNCGDVDICSYCVGCHAPLCSYHAWKLDTDHRADAHHCCEALRAWPCPCDTCQLPERRSATCNDGASSIYEWHACLSYEGMPCIPCAEAEERRHLGY